MKILLILIASLIIWTCKEKTKEIIVKEAPPPVPINPEPPPVEPTDPPEPPPVRFTSFESFENAQLQLLNSQNDNDRLNTRFLSVCDQTNQGKPADNYIKALDKALNSVSLERDIIKSRSTGVDCLRAIDLDDYGMDAADWALIVVNNPFANTFESFTTEGDFIKDLTGENQPWLPAHVFAFTAFDANVYSTLIDLPANLNALQLQLGLDLQANFDDEDRETYLFGHTGSPIAIGKPRMHLRTEIDDGHYYQSYDIVIASVGLAEKNIFQSPFPVEARSQFTLLPDGHEVIFSLPNSLHGYYLSDGVGNQQAVAPLDLVFDSEASQLSLNPEIDYLACNRCHANGLIERQDEIFAKVSQDNTFDIVDIQKSQFWHGRGGELASTLASDNQRYQSALRQLGIQPGDPDWINFYTDKLRRESNINAVAAMMFLDPGEFAQRLLTTVISKNEIGSLVDGKTISFEQLQQTLGTFVIEANIFRDDFGE